MYVLSLSNLPVKYIFMCKHCRVNIYAERFKPYNMMLLCLYTLTVYWFNNCNKNNSSQSKVDYNKMTYNIGLIVVINDTELK